MPKVGPAGVERESDEGRVKDGGGRLRIEVKADYIRGGDVVKEELLREGR